MGARPLGGKAPRGGRPPLHGRACVQTCVGRGARRGRFVAGGCCEFNQPTPSKPNWQVEGGRERRVVDMSQELDFGPWFVRVAHNQVAVGIFACTKLKLAGLIDEVCEPDACEYKRLPPGGFIFGGEVVLHDWDPETDAEHMDDGWLTESWCAVYDDEGAWERVDTP